MGGVIVLIIKTKLFLSGSCEKLLSEALPMMHCLILSFHVHRLPCKLLLSFFICFFVFSKSHVPINLGSWSVLGL
jgi:hypothetical protein